MLTTNGENIKGIYDHYNLAEISQAISAENGMSRTTIDPLAEKPGGKIGKVATPDRPTVVSLGEMPFMADALLLQ